MISFQTCILGEDGPIYRQLVRFVQRGIAAGTIRAGEELPSRRTVSALLGVNPNTVQKAYRLLEEEGLIQSRTGAKSCVSADPGLAERVRRQLLAEDARRLVDALRQSGASKEECLALFERLWDEEKEEDE